MERNGGGSPVAANGTAGWLQQLDLHRGGSGEPLVLIHGIGHTWRGWQPMLPGLEQRFEVLAPDLPGYGCSPPLRDGIVPSPEALADAVEALLDSVGWEAPLVAGNSLGGWIALSLARRGRVRAAIGISPAGMWTDREFAWAKAVLRAMRSAAGGPVPDSVLRSPIGRTLLAGPGFGRPWRLDPNVMQEHSQMFATCPAFEATLGSAGDDPLISGLGDVEVPVLLLWGKRDVILLPRQGRRFERHLPDAELKYLSGCGHVPMSDDPDLLVREIAEFANRTAPVAAVA